MTEPIKVAALGFWHVHALEYATYARDRAETSLALVWDDDPERGRDAAAELGVPFEPDLDAAIAAVDAVTVTTATSQHTAVIGAAIAAGRHVFSEKVLAPTVEDCESLIAAATATGAKITVSLPRLNHGYTSTIQKIIDDGRLGQISYARVRLSHHGATDGWLAERFFDPADAIGGALTDLGCHPVYLTQLFLGLDVNEVAAVYRSMTGRAVEDNAVVTLGYPGGAIGVAETGFVTHIDPFTIEVHGTDAAVRFAEGDETVQLITADGRTSIPVDADSPDAFDQWIAHILGDTVAEDNLRRSVELTRVVAAATEAATTGRTVYPAN